MTPLYHPNQPIPSTSGIYRITCTVTKKFYIGSSSNLHIRRREHFNDLRKNKHVNRKLQNAFNKYGEQAFTFEVIELVLPIFLLEREQYHIDKLKPHFNLAPVAGSLLGIERTHEHNQKISQALMGKPSPMRGIPRPPEVIEQVIRTKQAKAKLRERPCENCGKPFLNTNRPNTAKFCSPTCAHTFHRHHIQRTCVVCGTVFSRQPAKISDYCSAECSYQAQRKPYEEAFWEKVDKSGDCWLWTGGMARGYGLFKTGSRGRTISAHRFSYELSYGPIPDKVIVRHSCNNPTCVRPDHLFLRN